MRLGAGLLALALFLSLRSPPVSAQQLTPPKEPPKEPWSPEQATGAPDTLEAEDAPTAWTPMEPDAGNEWLLVRFERAVAIAEVRIRESLNPGAVRKVSASLEDGVSFLLWEGDDPTVQAPSFFEVIPDREVVARAILVEMDTARRPGWNAIDAVELVGRDGSRQWAAEAAASSTYATVGGMLAGELAPSARTYTDAALGIKMLRSRILDPRQSRPARRTGKNAPRVDAGRRRDGGGLPVAERSAGEPRAPAGPPRGGAGGGPRRRDPGTGGARDWRA